MIRWGDNTCHGKEEQVPQRDGYIPGVPCYADTSHPDPDAAAQFYGGLFGWELENVLPPDFPRKYFAARMHGGDVGAVGSIPDGAQPIAAWNTYISVESADETAAKVREAGGTVVAEPYDVGDAGRMAVFADPEGAAFRVQQARNHKGWRIVNEHGSVVLSTLNTRNADAARGFYNSVFGWGTLTLAGGVEMWTLAGYGDHLERESPPERERLVEMGAPAGFEDVVAGINRIPDDQSGVSAHWGITFAVDDADKIAEKAAELGGKVIASPFDVPWRRMTVIADPQGATFTASQLVPENSGLARP
jgi:predicted enzyme related to lactoylglutathione lyase